MQKTGLIFHVLQKISPVYVKNVPLVAILVAYKFFHPTDR